MDVNSDEEGRIIVSTPEEVRGGGVARGSGASFPKKTTIGGSAMPLYGIVLSPSNRPKEYVICYCPSFPFLFENNINNSSFSIIT